MAKGAASEDGARRSQTEAECEPLLFDWQAITENAHEVVITLYNGI
jgi:hypothetical protein